MRCAARALRCLGSSCVESFDRQAVELARPQLTKAYIKADWEMARRGAGVLPPTEREPPAWQRQKWLIAPPGAADPGGPHQIGPL